MAATDDSPANRKSLQLELMRNVRDMAKAYTEACEIIRENEDPGIAAMFTSLLRELEEQHKDVSLTGQEAVQGLGWINKGRTLDPNRAMT